MFTLCEYVGFIKVKPKSLSVWELKCLPFQKVRILPVSDSELSTRSSRRLRCRKCSQNTPAQSVFVNNKFVILFTILETWNSSGSLVENIWRICLPKRKTKISLFYAIYSTAGFIMEYIFCLPKFISWVKIVIYLNCTNFKSLIGWNLERGWWLVIWLILLRFPNLLHGTQLL